MRRIEIIVIAYVVGSLFTWMPPFFYLLVIAVRP